MWNPENPGFNKDLLRHKQALQNAVPKDALVITGNDISHFISFYYINKKGWVFDSDNITKNQVRDWVSKGATYLYSDSRPVDENKDIAVYFEKLLIQQGSIRVYKLRAMQ